MKVSQELPMWEIMRLQNVSYNSDELILTDTEGFAQILEQLMQAAGPQGPLPATDAVIEGLPRVKLDEDAISEQTDVVKLIVREEFIQGLPCVQR